MFYWLTIKTHHSELNCVQSKPHSLKMDLTFSCFNAYIFYKYTKCFWCLFHLLLRKLFLPRSNFFEHIQYFLNTVKFFDHGQKQDFTLWIYIFEHDQKCLNTFKNYWTQSKIFEHGQKIFELAYGLGMSVCSQNFYNYYTYPG